jgi:hypothetical protein
MLFGLGRHGREARCLVLFQPYQHYAKTTTNKRKLTEQDPHPQLEQSPEQEQVAQLLFFIR